MTLIFVLVTFMLASLVHAGALVVLGTTFGADVALIGVFIGPAILRGSIGGWPIRVNLLPLGTYVNFREHVAPARLGVMLLGANVVVLVIAGAFVGIGDAARTAWAVWRWAITGGLVSNALEATAAFEHVIATLEATSFASALGMVAASCVAINLLPIPMMNGGDAILQFWQGLWSLPDNTREKIQLTGATVVLMLLVTWGYQLGKYVLTP